MCQVAPVANPKYGAVGNTLAPQVTWRLAEWTCRNVVSVDWAATQKGTYMIVFSRQAGETIMIGDDIGVRFANPFFFL